MSVIFLFCQCLAYVAKLYLSLHFPRLGEIKSISVPRLSGNYLNKRRFLDFFVLLEEARRQTQINRVPQENV